MTVAASVLTADELTRDRGVSGEPNPDHTANPRTTATIRTAITTFIRRNSLHDPFKPKVVRHYYAFCGRIRTCTT